MGFTYAWIWLDKQIIQATDDTNIQMELLVAWPRLMWLSYHQCSLALLGILRGWTHFVGGIGIPWQLGSGLRTLLWGAPSPYRECALLGRSCGYSLSDSWLVGDEQLRLVFHTSAPSAHPRNRPRSALWLRGQHLGLKYLSVKSDGPLSLFKHGNYQSSWALEGRRQRDH